MPPPIRPATATDVDQVVELVESAYRGERSRAGWTTEADLLDGQRVDAAMLGATLADPAVEVLVLDEADAGIVACCELRRPGPDGTAALGMFAVAPPRQALGLGRRLLGAAERRSGEDWGAARLRLQVLEARHELIEWYGRRGYRRTGGHAPFPYGDERFGRPRRADLRFVVLEKPLRPGWLRPTSPG